MVVLGLDPWIDPTIHVFLDCNTGQTWMVGSSPTMTTSVFQGKPLERLVGNDLTILILSTSKDGKRLTLGHPSTGSSFDRLRMRIAWDLAT